jgi:outer membrane protein assembly factor BamB
MDALGVRVASHPGFVSLSIPVAILPGLEEHPPQLMHKSLHLSRACGFGAIFLLSLSSIVLGAPGDWPQFRGPSRDGISAETGLLQDLPPGGPPLAWKATGLGVGYCTVAVVANRIYTVGEDKETSSVIALDAADGKKLWATKLGKAGAPGTPAFEGPRATPTVDVNLLVVASQWGELACLDTAEGKELWRKDYAKDFGGKRPNWGYSESPLIDGNTVVITPGGAEGAIVALDKKSGNLLWRSKGFTDSPHYSSLLLAEIGGVRQYIQLTSESVVGVAAADGKVLWQAPRKGRTAVIPTPVYSDGYVYVTSGYGVGCNLFKVTESGGTFTAQEVYANKVMDNKQGGVIKIGDYVYGHADAKGWTCQDFKTGASKWVHSSLGKGSIVYADGRFYLRAEDKGTLALIEASPDAFKEHGRFEQPDRSDKKAWPYPVIANGKLYLRDWDTLLCYDVKAK